MGNISQAVVITLTVVLLFWQMNVYRLEEEKKCSKVKSEISTDVLTNRSFLENSDQFWNTTSKFIEKFCLTIQVMPRQMKKLANYSDNEQDLLITLDTFFQL
ncbi:MAG: hypothetical protein MHPSP_001392 [Paramarteilia canceri]